MGVFKNEIGRPSNEVIKKRRILKCIIGMLVIIVCLLVGYIVNDKINIYTVLNFKKDGKVASIKNNSLNDFDISFLQLENNKENKIYSPLSIKYALKMLGEGANGETKTQISNLLGDYKTNKYTNSKNMSFANAMFIKDSYKNSIKNDYINSLKNKYNAKIIYDSFQTPDNLNSWVSNKTFNLVNNLTDDISNEDFVLVNALAIDMEWVKKIQSEEEIYLVTYPHRKYGKYIDSIVSGYSSIDFKDYSKQAKGVEIGAVINKYDIVNALGEQKIRKTVGAEYKKWLEKGVDNCGFELEEVPDVNTYLNNYIKEINEGYKDISSSTDFDFYVDENVKVFAKDLKEYDGTTLQYIGIMPKKESLDTYIKNTNASKINSLIDSLKPIELESFKDGVITEIAGYIPMFKFDYKLDLKSDLNKLGITNVFTPKADLSNITSDNAIIGKVIHKSNIEFSNDGIKAAAVNSVLGFGDGEGCGFDYIYEVPVEKIDLTFDNPYLFLIRNKKTGEIWFTGTVYEPLEYKEPSDLAGEAIN